MDLQWFMTYITIQWICSIFLSYSVRTKSFAFSQITKMRRISYVCLITIVIFSLLGYYDIFQDPLWGYLIVPLVLGLIIFSIFYSTLTFIVVFNTTHEIKQKSTDFYQIFSLFFLPIGLLTLKVKNEYKTN